MHKASVQSPTPKQPTASPGFHLLTPFGQQRPIWDQQLLSIHLAGCGSCPICNAGERKTWDELWIGAADLTQFYYSVGEFVNSSDGQDAFAAAKRRRGMRTEL